jgi:hypothetical protein
METSSNTPVQTETSSKVNSKISQVVPSGWHVTNPKYAGHIRIGPENHFTPWFDSRNEAELELRCLEKRLSYELVETVEDEGCYPERAKLIEEKYQASGRTNSLYTDLNTEDGSVSNNTSK